MTNQDYKHREELFMISSILQSYGISEKNCNCSDRPDIIIHLSERKVIGVEVMTYRSGNNIESENALNKILTEYGQILDKKLSERYLVTVNFYGADLPNNINFKRQKDKIFEEIEKCRLNASDKIFNEYIENANFEKADFLAESYVSCVTAFLCGDTDEVKLMEIIEKKGRKLLQYKSLPQNSNINEWWLVIYFPSIEHTDYKNLKLAKKISSDYDHIFLTEILNEYKQIK